MENLRKMPLMVHYRLHIYMRDYLLKRGFAESAHSLTMEAGIVDENGPPIKSDQGLLFELVLFILSCLNSVR